MAFLFFFPVKKEWKIIISLRRYGCIFFYRFIPSLFRSVIMATVVAASYLVQRKNICSIRLDWPELSGSTCRVSLFTPSYQLSFAATFGLITLSDLSELFKLPIRNILLRKFSRLLFQLPRFTSKFVATLPILMYHFNQFYVYGCLPTCFQSLSCRLRCGLRLQVSCFNYHSTLGTPCMLCAELLIHLMVKGPVGALCSLDCAAGFASYPEIYAFFTIFVLGFI